MNALNAPAELCEAVKERFLAFLNGFVVTDQADAEPSQSITHSQGSGAGAGGAAAANRGPRAPPPAAGRCQRDAGPPGGPPPAAAPV